MKRTSRLVALGLLFPATVRKIGRRRVAFSPLPDPSQNFNVSRDGQMMMVEWKGELKIFNLPQRTSWKPNSSLKFEAVLRYWNLGMGIQVGVRY